MKSEHFRMQLFAGGRDDFEPKGRPSANAAGSPEALPEKLTWIVRDARPPTAAPLFNLFS
jgi:hypothetical protein